MPTAKELAQQELQRRYSLQGRTQVAPRVQTMSNARPTVRSKLHEFLRDTVDATGLGGGYRQGLLNAAGDIESAVDFAPIIGDAIAVDEAAQAYGQGDMVGAGINMMGVVPVVGDVASKGAKAARSSLRSLYHGTSPEAAKAIDQFGFDLDKTADGSAWFTTNPNIGEVAAAGKGGVIQRQLDESNLKLASYDETDKYSNGELIGMGYDGAVYPDGEGGAHYEIWNQDKLNQMSALRGLDINDMDEDEYIRAINPQGIRIAPEARPNLGMGDMYGMAPRNSSEIMTQELPSGEVVRYVEGGDGVYALGYNPDLGEEDVIGYMLGGGDSSELAVVDKMQSQGIGGNLSYLYRSQNPMAQSGGFTEAGEGAARKAYRRMMGYE